MKKLHCFVCLLALVWVSCWRPGGTRSFADKETLLGYINDAGHGLLQQRQAGNGVDYQLRYQPAILLPGGERDSLGGQFYFVLSLSYRNRELLGQLPHEAYAQLVNLFSFGMDRMVHFVLDGDRIEDAMMVFYQPTYNLSSSNSLLVVGDRSWLQKCGTLRVQVDDFGLNTGRQEFEFAVDKLLDADRFEILNKD